MALKDNLKNAGDELERINDLGTEMQAIYGDIGNALKGLARDAGDFSTSISEAEKLQRDLAKSAQDLAGYTRDDLKDRKKQAEFEKKSEALARKQARLRSKMRVIQAQRVNATKAEQKVLTKVEENLRNSLDYTNEVAGGFDDILETSKKLEKTNPFSGLADIIGEIPVLSKVFPEFGKAAQTFRDNIVDGQGAMKSLGKSSLQVAGALGKMATIDLVRRGVIEMDKAQQRVVGFQRELGLSLDNASKLQVEMSTIANASGESFFNSARFAEAQQKLNEAMGTNVTLSGEMAENFSLLVYRLGLSTEEATKFNKVALGLGKNAREFTGEVNARVMLLNGENKLQIDRRQILKDISQVSARTQLSIKAQGKSITDSVYSARKLGLTLGDIESISDNLLDFEKSISNELEAELLTGKDLNLQRARAAALNNDFATVAAEISKQVGSAAEFGKMNRIQQEAIANAVGMTADDLAKSLKFQENISKLSKDSQYSDAQNFEELKEKVRLRAKEVGFQKALSEVGNKELENQLDAATIQEQIAEKQAKAADELLEALGPKGLQGTLETLNASIDSLTTAMYILAGANLLGSAAQLIKGGKSLVKGSKSLGTTVKNLFKGGGTKTATSAVMKATGNQVYGAAAQSAIKAGTATATKVGSKTTSKMVAKQATKSGSKAALKAGTKVAAKTGFKSLLKRIPVLGSLVGVGFAIDRAIKGDYAGAAMEVGSAGLGLLDLVAPGLGTGLSLAADAGIAARDISRAGTITPTATPMATGGIVNRATNAIVGEAGPEAVIPLNEFYRKFDELISVVKEGGDVYLDSTKMGRAMAVSSYKLQ